MNLVPACVEILESRALLSSTAVFGPAADAQGHDARNGQLVDQLSTSTPVTASTIPANGDLNPYGAAFVPQGFARGGVLRPGDLLVSNFNASSNEQGTGTTIVRITPDGQTSTFFQGNAGLGLTTALGVLKNGYVIVGNLPTLDGTGATAQQGSLLILNSNGKLVATLSDSQLLDGPWDLAVDDDGSRAQIFVSNALSGTVTRIDLSVSANGSAPKVLSETQIASGYAHRTDPAALLLGPTGLAFDEQTDTLFVASTADNAVFAIHDAEHRNSDAGTGTMIYNDPAHLHGPLALVLAPNDDLIVSNGDGVNADPAQSSELVEFTQHGKFVGEFQVDPNPGSAFGIALEVIDGQVHFAAVDDFTNTVSIWTLKSKPCLNTASKPATPIPSP